MTERLNLKIMGEQTMHCSGCERTVQFTLARVPGVRSVKANHLPFASQPCAKVGSGCVAGGDDI